MNLTERMKAMNVDRWLLSIYNRWAELRVRESTFLDTLPMAKSLAMVDGMLEVLVNIVEAAEKKALKRSKP